MKIEKIQIKIDEISQRKINKILKGRTFFILPRCYTFAFDALSRVYIKLNKYSINIRTLYREVLKIYMRLVTQGQGSLAL